MPGRRTRRQRGPLPAKIVYTGRPTTRTPDHADHAGAGYVWGPRRPGGASPLVILRCHVGHLDR